MYGRWSGEKWTQDGRGGEEWGEKWSQDDDVMSCLYMQVSAIRKGLTEAHEFLM